MNKNYNRLLALIPRTEADSSIERAIFVRIEREQNRQAKLKTFIFGSTTLIACVSLFYLSSYLLDSFVQSGLYEYVSVAFSGGGELGLYWQELSLSLIESVPLLSLVLILVSLGTILWGSVGTFVSARRLTFQA